MRRCIILSILSLIILSCSGYKTDKIRVETFQRFGTSWDQTLLDDMRREASTIKSVQFKHNTALSTEEQISQIDNAIRNKVNAIIVNPFDDNSITSVVEKAFDAGIYVILVGQKLSTFKYNAFAGIDNPAMGRLAANYVCSQLNGRGNIILLEAYRNALFYRERYNAFKHVIDSNPDINIVGTVETNWSWDLAHRGMDSLKTSVLGNTKVDLVYSFGDMIIGAIESQKYPDAIYVGSDGVPGDCLEAVINGTLQAAFFNPTGGKEAVDVAIALIKGMAYQKDNYIQPTLVNSSNAIVIKNSLTAISNYKNKIDILRDDMLIHEAQIDRLKKDSSILLIITSVFGFILAVCICCWIKSIKKSKDIISKTRWLEEQCRDMTIQTEIAERMRWQLESERDAMIEASLATQDNAPKDVVADAVFLNKFKQKINEQMENPDLSIDDLASFLNVSRAQLFRRIKTESGATPNELLQAMRLEKAKELLHNGGKNISEIAYSVGFASPAYFSKCYKERFGVTPSDFCKKPH